MAKARKRELSRSPAPDAEELLARARARLEADGVVKVSSLGPRKVRAEVATALFALGFDVTESEVRRPGSDDPLPRLLAALEATRDEVLGLSFIPKIVKHLTPSMGADAAMKLLLDAARRGKVELRPEGGLNRLTREELALCPPGPQGTRLSWARAVEGSKA